jgi:hypothetical protein
MLIDLTRFGPLTIDPGQYKTTVAVRIDAPTNKGCGVFAGRHQEFASHEEGKLAPIIEQEEDIDLKTFVLDRPEEGFNRDRIYRWTYAAIGWDNAVYVEHPYVYVLTLQVQHNEDGPLWTLSISQRHDGFTVVLADYETGALARGIVKRIT